MPDCPKDLWGIDRDIEGFRAKASREPFARWTADFLAKQSKRREEPPPECPNAEALRRTAETARDAALAYVLTGDAAFAAQSLAGLEALAAASEPWLSPGHAEMYPEIRADLITAEIAKACATALGWLAPALDDDATRAFAEMIAERGGQPIRDSARRGAWWADALNSNWTAVLNGGLLFAALAIRPFEPTRSDAWLAYSRERLVAMLDLAAEEAAGVEGAGYWLYCFGSILDAAEALRNATGENLFDHPFWDRCSRFLPYLALPDFSAWANYADTAYRGLGGSAFFHAVAARKRDGLAQWFADRILARHGGMDWRNLVFHDESVAPRPIDPEPCCRFFQSIHLASFRSDWGPDAVFLLFKGGSNAWSHTHLDLNSFFLTAYGERLATEPGPAPYSLHYWHSIEPPVSTAWHNCIVVDGAHQRVAAQYAMSLDLEEAGDCYSRLDGYLDADSIALVGGDASSAYGDTLAKTRREVVYLKPDIFVVFDELVPHPVRCHRNFEWMLHSEHPIAACPEGFAVQGERARLLVQPLFPRGWEAKTIAGRTVPKADDKPLHALSIRPPWHHKWNVDPSRSPYPDWHARATGRPLYPPSCRYLVVLSALRGDVSPRFAVEEFETGDACGVILRNDGETALVLFNPAGGQVAAHGIGTDALRAVVRQGPAGLFWAVAQGRSLTWNGTPLLQAKTRVTRTG